MNKNVYFFAVLVKKCIYHDAKGVIFFFKMSILEDAIVDLGLYLNLG